MKLLVLFSLLTLIILPVWAQSDGFPGRSIYKKVKIYDTSQLNKQFDDVIVVDVRSNFEFTTLHINNAINIPLNSKKFIEEIKQLKNQGKPIIFYCNGHTCYKSYKAVQKSEKFNITNTFSYDAGIFDWANAYPEKATLLGKSPVDTSHLLGKQDLEKYLLEPQVFTSKAHQKSIILDIREPAQRGLVELFPYRQQNIAMDESKKLKTFLTSIKASGKTLLVYDEAGKQVRWLQYYLEDIGISKYYFMKGGVKNFFKSLRKSS